MLNWHCQNSLKCPLSRALPTARCHHRPCGIELDPNWISDRSPGYLWLMHEPAIARRLYQRDLRGPGLHQRGPVLLADASKHDRVRPGDQGRQTDEPDGWEPLRGCGSARAHESHGEGVSSRTLEKAVFIDRRQAVMHTHPQKELQYQSWDTRGWPSAVQSVRDSETLHRGLPRPTSSPWGWGMTLILLIAPLAVVAFKGIWQRKAHP